MIRTLTRFAIGTALGTLALAGVFYSRRMGDSGEARYGAIVALVGGVVCGVVTVLALALKLWAESRSQSEQLMAVTGGMLLRMVGVLALSMAIFLNVPMCRETRERELVFWSAILIGYLGTLALETVLSAKSLRSRRSAHVAEPRTRGAGE